MMKRKQNFLFATFFIMVMGFQNCSDTKFGTAASSSEEGSNSSSSSSNSSSSSEDTCTEQLQTTTLPVKTLFIVDTSGSNASDSKSSGSDNDKSVRGGSIQQFFSTYSSHANFAWGFLTFSGSSATSLIGSTSNPVFSASPQSMQNAISSFYGMRDGGLTPYRAALSLARQTVLNDTQSSTSNTKYVLVFLSDGLPDPEVSDSTLISDIQSIIALRPGQITFNTIYYGGVDNVANQRLRTMATAGNGQFLDTNSNSTGKYFVISDVISVAGLNCGSP